MGHLLNFTQADIQEDKELKFRGQPMNASIQETNIVFQSVRATVNQSHSVAIAFPRITEICLSLDVSDLIGSIWDYDLTEKYDTRTRLLLYLLFNSMNFSFWGMPQWSTEFQGKLYTGSHGMMTALVRSMEEGVPILDPTFLINISRRETDFIFRGNTTITMPDDRVLILKELGYSLSNHGIKSFELLFAQELSSPQAIIDTIIKLLPSFNDISTLGGIRVYFFKRVQLLVAQCMKLVLGWSFDRFADFFTVFADYRLPQALRHLGVLRYSNELSKKIDSGEILERGCLEETEIRCNTIWAAELIKRKLSSEGINVNSIQIDSWLWRYAKRNDNTIAPHHKVRTIYY